MVSESRSRDGAEPPVLKLRGEAPPPLGPHTSAALPSNVPHTMRPAARLTAGYVSSAALLPATRPSVARTRDPAVKVTDGNSRPDNVARVVCPCSQSCAMAAPRVCVSRVCNIYTPPLYSKLCLLISGRVLLLISPCSHLRKQKNAALNVSHNNHCCAPATYNEVRHALISCSK